MYIGWPASCAPSGSGITTYDGIDALSLPRPYVTHEPMLGNPGTMRPVKSSYCAAEWTTMSP